MKGFGFQTVKQILQGSLLKEKVSILAANQIGNIQNGAVFSAAQQKRGANSLSLPPCSKSKTCPGTCRLRLKQLTPRQSVKNMQTSTASASPSTTQQRRAIIAPAEQGRYYPAHQSALEFIRNDDKMAVHVKVGDTTMNIPYIWLKDSCQSEKYFNHKNHQKIPDWELLNKDLRPESLEYAEEGPGLVIAWKDGHVSKFDADWLVKNFFPKKVFNRVRRHLWNKTSMNSEPLPAVRFEDHMNTDEGLAQSLSNLVRYGFTIVSEAPKNAEGTQAASERVSEVQESVFGGMWTVSPKMANNDSAYTYDDLGAHTDTTYMNSPAGIEVFHCLEHDGTGGETLLVDGFQIMEFFRHSDPNVFKILTETDVPFEYKEEPMDGKPSYYMVGYNKHAEVHSSSGELVSFRYNPYHRGVISTVDGDELPAFFTAYDKLAKAIQDPQNEFWLKLKPGNVLLVDNWRVMHGRSAFTGFRLLSGCYLSRDEWLSRARVYGVL